MKGWRMYVVIAALAILTLAMGLPPHEASAVPIAAGEVSGELRKSLASNSWSWPKARQLERVFLLQDYNTRVVVIGTTLLACAAGMVGSFTLLRKRALLGDALSHATLPGIALAFLLSTALGEARSLGVLLAGATLSGLIGVAIILALRNATRLKEDTALGAVLSIFFGIGVALLGIVQQMETGHAAGLEAFIYGKTASMGSRDTFLIAGAAVLCIGASLLFHKEFKLLCFDEAFGGSEGVPVMLLDWILMALVVVVTIVGLQAVGLILIIALLVIPAAAARFWTERLWPMFLIAGGLGAMGGWVGAASSALFPNLPSGAVIVLVCSLLFLASMVFGTSRGLLRRSLHRRQLHRKVDHQHLLRALYELAETADEEAAEHEVPWSDLLQVRSWAPRRLQTAVRRDVRRGWLDERPEGVRLTRSGAEEASRLTRQHRLWELYLIHYADVAPARVDRDADAIEHVLEPDVVEKLESMLRAGEEAVPPSPHAVEQEQTPLIGQRYFPRA